MNNLPLFIAHRGFRIGVDENTYNAFERAAELHMDFIELDIHLTRDKRLVVMHDDSVNRTTDGTGKISDLTWEQISKMHSVPGGFSIPLLDDILDRFNSIDLPKLMIEVKSDHGTDLDDSSDLISIACKVIKEKADPDRIVISSRSIADLSKVHQLLPMIPLCLNISSCREFSMKKFLRTAKKEDLPLPFYQISQRSSKINKKFVQKCHNFGIQALSWNFISLEKSFRKIKKFLRWKIDGILFDAPELVEMVRKYQP